MAGFAVRTNAQRRNDRAARDTVRTLNSQLDDLRLSLDYEIRNNGGSDALGDAMTDLSELRNAVDSFDRAIGSRNDGSREAEAIVASTERLRSGLESANAGNAIRRDMAAISQTVDGLAARYGVRAGTRNYPSTTTNPQRMPSGPIDVSGRGINGTYRLDPARSERVADVLASLRLTPEQRQDLAAKLEAPQELAILTQGDQVTIASSRSEPITFTADGRENTEPSGNSTLRTRASLRGDNLTISSLGGDTDYTIIFEPSSNGRQMKVTRRLTTSYLRETVFIDSSYTQSDTIARLGIDQGTYPQQNRQTGGYSSNDPADNGSNSGRYGGSPGIATTRTGNFVIPNGTSVTATLESPIDTKASQNNDRFRLRVTGPDQYRDAVIEGYISGVGRSGQISGRPNVTFNFTRITLRDGRSYDFAGSLNSIRDTQGKDVRVDAEGRVSGDNQTTETVKRGGIGAGIGAIIGAIAGGGKGAAIGAIIGGGAGAGSVAIQGRNDIKLEQGTEFRITSTSPYDRGPR